MTVAVLLDEASRAGVHVEPHGDGLHIRVARGAVPADMRARLTEAKAAVVAFLELRAHLSRLADVEGLPASVVGGLSTEDVAACDDLTDDILRAYLRAVHRGGLMDASVVPGEYTQAARCGGCGPVWLWVGAPARVIACPWCLCRIRGRAVPRPEALS